MIRCALCPFPLHDPRDRLPLLDGHVHAACALAATKSLGLPLVAVLLRRRIATVRR